MKILFTVHNYPPEFMGGVERIVSLLARYSATSGHEVHVFCGSTRSAEEPRVEMSASGSVTVHRFIRGRGYPSPVDPHDPGCDAAFDRLLAEVAPDAIHVHHWHHLTSSLISIAARRRIPAVVSLHDYWTDCSLFFRMPSAGAFCTMPESKDACFPCVMSHFPTDGSELHEGFEWRFRTLDQEIGLAQRIFVSSVSHRDRLLTFARDRSVLEQRLRVIPFGFPELAVPTKRPSSDGRIVIAHWGNLSPLKGVLDLVVAASKARAASRIRVMLFGKVVDPGLLAALDAARGEVVLDHRGAYDVESLAEGLGEASFAVFPSRAHETHSLVVDEAIVFGLPLIVSDRGAMGERIGRMGRIVPAGDIDSLASAIDEFAVPGHCEIHRSTADGLRTMLDFAQEILGAIEEVVRDPRPLPSYIADHGRDRLAFRLRRIEEIHRYVVAVEQRGETLRRAISGDRAAIEDMASTEPELSRRIEQLLRQDDVE